jgi:hypothetical protein
MTPSKHDNARGQAGEVGKARYIKRSNYSTVTEAQRRRIVEMLRTGRKTTLDFRLAGIMQSQTRIFELRAQGYDLPTVGRVTIRDDQGYPHHGVALYELIAEPSDRSGPTETAGLTGTTGNLFDLGGAQ